MKVNWLKRDIAAPGPYLCLCLSEKEFLAAMRRLGINYTSPWLNGKTSHATTHLGFNQTDNVPAAVVCLGDVSGKESIQIAALLVHEAVHIWQEWCTYIGEDNPGSEQEAYAIQTLSQTLMYEYARRIKND